MALDVGSYEERQEEELQVLQSIYGGDVEDLRTKAAWNAWQPTKTKLTLYPQESQGPQSQIFAQVQMVVTCSSRYPDDVPTVELLNSKNVPEKKMNELKMELNELAKQLLGEVMIMELAEKVREFLHSYNKPPAKSFHEQMIDKQRRAEKERAQRQHEQQEMERRRREEEMRQIEDMKRKRLQELNEERNESRCRKGGTGKTDEEGVFGSPRLTSLSVLSPIPASPQSGTVLSTISATPVCPVIIAARRQRRTSTPRRGSESEMDEQDGKTKGAAVCTLIFKKAQNEWHVQRGKPQQSQGGGGSTVYCGMDQRTGENVAITEWVFKWRTVAKKAHFKAADLDEDKEGKAYLKQVQSIEQEASSLMNLSHPNIIRYMAFRYQREPGKITVHVLTEFCGGSNLGVHLRSGKSLPFETLRHHTGGMLNALHYLHDHTVVHKLFRASCVFVDNQGKTRLADYAIDKRLRELYREIDTASSKVMFEDSTDRMPPTFGRSSKKGDIYQLGVTVLALTVGDYITDTVPQIPANLPPPLADFLNKCLMRDDRQRWSATQLLEHPFVKDPLPPSPKEGFSGGQGDHNNEVGSDDDKDLIEYRTSIERNGKSRLTQEFHVVCTLGKGGFGDVLKVKNKLDGQLYAIKRILLNPFSKHFSERKITREVSLLSKLHHENIVRYCGAWMEYTDDPAVSETSSSSFSSRPSPQTGSSSSRQPPETHVVMHRNSLEAFEDVEQLAPQMAGDSVDWSVGRSLGATSHGLEDVDDSSDEDDDDDDDDEGHWGIGASFLRWHDLSDSVNFQNEDGSPSDENQQATDSGSQTETPKKSESEGSSVLWTSQPLQEEELPKLRYLYIQMQYCENSTLRRAIDMGLSENMERVWRYFRGITEGLLYIHEQNMIHRDLKPVNIFLDSNDLVKIGDFGLATTDVVKQKTGLADSSMTAPSHLDPLSSSRSGSGDGDLTGEVGTALYVSPEMMKGGSKLRYDQKVDIYSLGIIFFEMIYKRLPTLMERIHVLTNLRKPDIIFPRDFDEHGDLESQAALLRQMLNHDPSQRPSSRDVLASPHLPAVQQAEAEFNRRMEEALSNPEGQIYRRVLTHLFSQKYSRAMDETYNMDQTKAKNLSNPLKSMLLRDVATERVEHIFKCHGAVQFNTPLLMPRPPQYATIEQLLPCFLDKSGAVVNLPFDLRLPFARYVAHNCVLNLKRYSIERVYRQLRAQSLHPREVIECAFDIVTTARNSVVPDAELLTVVEQVINQFPVLQHRPYMVCMNHTKLIEAVLLNAGVPEDKLSAIMETLVAHQTTEDTIRVTMKQHNISLSATAESQLKTYLETEAEYSVVSSKLRPLTKQSNNIGYAAKMGLHELENIQSTARALGLKMKINVGLGLVYNLRQHSGLIFQVYYKKHHKKQKTREFSEVIASGGRYDKLVSEFSSRGGPLEQGAVGVSIAFDIVLHALTHEKELQVPSPCDVMVCTVGHNPMKKERLDITRNLLDAGIRTEVQYEPLEDIEELQDKCRSSGIPFLVILKDKEGDANCVKVKTLDVKGAGTEKRVNNNELVEFIQQKLASNKTDKEVQESCTAGGGGGSGSGTGRSSERERERASTLKLSNSPTFSFTYTCQLSQKAKRRGEALVCNKAPKWLTGEVEVVMSELPDHAIKTIQGFIELNKEESDFDKSIEDIHEMLARHRKSLPSVTEPIREIRFDKKKPHILLYGTKDDTVRLLT